MLEWYKVPLSSPDLILLTARFDPAQRARFTTWATLTKMERRGQIVRYGHRKVRTPKGKIITVSLWALPQWFDRHRHVHERGM